MAHIKAISVVLLCGSTQSLADESYGGNSIPGEVE